MIPTLYLTRNGLLEPLGQSQVLAYLRGLSSGYRVTLISYEKDEDWLDTARVGLVRTECEALGIRWLPQRFRPRPKLLAPAFSMIRMVWLVRREVRGQEVRLMHARSYIPAAVALLVGRMTGVPFLFDMRALWPEELITAGRLRRGSFLHRLIAAAERACLKQAAGVISLTHAAVGHLQREYPHELAGQRVVVIPTCADLDRFTPGNRPGNQPRVHGCIGTVLSGWFRTNWLSAWFAAAAQRDPLARFEIITRDDPSGVRAAIDPGGLLGEKLTIAARHPEEMPGIVRMHDVSVMFFSEGLSKLGSSPTRMAEVLGSGLPVVANAGVGDVARIVTEHRVGVLVKGPGEDELNASLAELEDLLADPGLSDRCRSAAETVFSLDSGTRSYARLYGEVINGSLPECAA